MRILNLKSKILNLERGFTIVELLVVIGIIGMISAIVSAIIVVTLRSVTKSALLTVINQNGDYAINQITENIRYARNFGGVSNDNITYQTTCIANSTQYRFLKVSGFDGGTTTYVCLNGTPPNVASVSAAGTMNLLDTTAVSLVSCNITCSQTSGADPPIIGISFSLQQKKNTTAVESLVTPVTFNTSLIMRNR